MQVSAAIRLSRRTTLAPRGNTPVSPGSNSGLNVDHRNSVASSVTAAEPFCIPNHPPLSSVPYPAFHVTKFNTGTEIQPRRISGRPSLAEIL